MAAKRILLLLIEAWAVSIIVIIFVLISKENDWCNSDLNAGECQLYTANQCCYCIAEIRTEDAMESEAYGLAQSQCNKLNGTVASLEDISLRKWLAMALYNKGIQNALVSLHKMDLNWYWIKFDSRTIATDDIWMSDVQPEPYSTHATLNVEIYNNEKLRNNPIYGMKPADKKLNSIFWYICEYEHQPVIMEPVTVVNDSSFISTHEVVETVNYTYNDHLLPVTPTTLQTNTSTELENEVCFIRNDQICTPEDNDESLDAYQINKHEENHNAFDNSRINSHEDKDTDQISDPDEESDKNLNMCPINNPEDEVLDTSQMCSPEEEGTLDKTQICVPEDKPKETGEVKEMRSTISTHRKVLLEHFEISTGKKLNTKEYICDTTTPNAWIPTDPDCRKTVGTFQIGGVRDYRDKKKAMIFFLPMEYAPRLFPYEYNPNPQYPTAILASGQTVLFITKGKMTMMDLKQFKTSVGPSTSTLHNHAAATILNGTAVICGGYLSGGIAMKSCEMLVEDEWIYISADMNYKHANHAMVTVGQYIYAIGGGDPEMRQVERYSMTTNIWQEVASMSKARKNFGATVLSGRIYVCGGDLSRKVMNACERYIPRDDRWENIASMNRGRRAFSFFALNNMIYAAAAEFMDGSEDRVALRSIEVYNPGNNKWEMVGDLVEGRVAQATAVVPAM